MDRGRLVAQGRVADLVASTRTVHLQVDDPASAFACWMVCAASGDVREGEGDLVVELDSLDRPELVRALVSAGIGVEGVSVRRRLEEVFLGLVAAPGGPSGSAPVTGHAVSYSAARRTVTGAAHRVACCTDPAATRRPAAQRAPDRPTGGAHDQRRARPTGAAQAHMARAAGGGASSRSSS